MRRGKETAIFLDTTYVLPYFGVKLDFVGGEELDNALSVYDEIHISEASILEAKAKLLRLAIKDQSFQETILGFGEKLDVLAGDQRVIFHGYRGSDDHYFNLISALRPRLNFFDQVILSQSISIGNLLTEDGIILSLCKNHEFRVSKEFHGFNILRLKDVLKTD